MPRQEHSFTGRMSLRLAPGLHKQLARLADAKGIEITALINMMLAESIPEWMREPAVSGNIAFRTSPEVRQELIAYAKNQNLDFDTVMNTIVASQLSEVRRVNLYRAVTTLTEVVLPKILQAREERRPISEFLAGQSRIPALSNRFKRQEAEADTILQAIMTIAEALKDELAPSSVPSKVANEKVAAAISALSAAAETRRQDV